MKDQEEQIKALLRAREGYRSRKEQDRVAEVDAELRNLGYEARKPVERAERRPAERPYTQR